MARVHHPLPPVPEDQESPLPGPCLSTIQILNTLPGPSQPMANISHFMIPADDVERARHFYSALFGWKIAPVRDTPGIPGMEAMQYHDISTGAARKGTLNSGGLYKRHMDEPVLDFVEVEDPGAVLADVERLGGKITMPKTDIPGVGRVAMILDTEGNAIGIWKPARK